MRHHKRVSEEKIMMHNTTHQFNTLRNLSVSIVDALDTLTYEYARLLANDGIDIRKSLSELKGDPFQQARIRMKSQLINVAVCGEFTSGKSFLISGLLNRIDWFLSEETDREGKRFDDYRSFLPAAPEETTSCPMVIIGNDRSDTRSHFSVYFEIEEDDPTPSKGESKKSKVKKIIGPVDRSEPYEHEEDIQRAMLAYVTTFREFSQSRLRQDLGLKVIKAELRIPQMPYPAVFHDLPGIGGATAEFAEVVQDAVRQADCIIYVASAERPLSAVELDLLRFVEEVAESNRCPVFFVLSKIDVHTKWERVLKKNNEFLKEAFQNDLLVAEGFIPVSPALYAKAQDQLAQGLIDQQTHDTWIENSGMPYLHEHLEKYLVNTSAPQHLQDIIFKMQAVQKALQRHIYSQIEFAKRPIQQAEEDIKQAQNLSRSLQRSRDNLHARLLVLIEQQMSQAFSPMDPDNLTKEFTTKLERRINSQNLTNAKVRHKLEQDIRQIRDEWLSREDVALNDRWEKAWGNYLQQAQIIIHEGLSDAQRQALKPTSATLDGGIDPIIPGIDVVIPLDAIASVIGLAGGALTGGGIMVGTVAIAVWPLAALFAAAGVTSFVAGLLKKARVNKELRQETLRLLAKYAQDVLKQLRQQGREVFMKHHALVMDAVGDMISREEDKIKAIQKRLDEEGEDGLAQNRQRISALNQLLDKTNKIEEQFTQFFTTLPNVPAKLSE